MCTLGSLALARLLKEAEEEEEEERGILGGRVRAEGLKDRLNI